MRVAARAVAHERRSKRDPFAKVRDFGVCGEHLTDERGAGARHSKDEDHPGRSRVQPQVGGGARGGKRVAGKRRHRAVVVSDAFQAIGRDHRVEGSLGLAEIVIGLAQHEQELRAQRGRQRLLPREAFDPGQHLVAGGIGRAVGVDPQTGEAAGIGREHLVERRVHVIETARVQGRFGGDEVLVQRVGHDLPFPAQSARHRDPMERCRAGPPAAFTRRSKRPRQREHGTQPG